MTTDMFHSSLSQSGSFSILDL